MKKQHPTFDRTEKSFTIKLNWHIKNGEVGENGKVSLNSIKMILLSDNSAMRQHLQPDQCK